jgi:heterodisulfide reductase subunit C
MLLSPDDYNDDLVRLIEEISGQDISACYQCGKCTAGCPVAFAMDLMPNQVIRLLQLGHYDEALKSPTLWWCASCLTCASRCPKDVDPAQVIEALRTILVRDGETRIEIGELPAEVLTDAPQQALIGGFRKLVGY